MAQEPVKLVTQTPVGNYIEVTLKRWFQTREFWWNGAAWVASLFPVLLQLLGTLNLSPWAFVAWTAFLHTSMFAANQYLKNTSKSMVVSKTTLENEAQAQAVQSPENGDGSP